MTSTTATSQSRSGSPKPRTLGELRSIPDFDARTGAVSVKNEIRRNLLRAIEKGDQLFPGVHGYEDTVIPQIINALLSRHNFILLGLRGQAKSRILRGLANLLDPEIPVVAGCEINDNPFAPLCRACKDKIASEGDSTPIAWMPRDHRYVEKLATPDVTIADIIGDVDPIRAARGGRDLSDELTIHYGLLPRANRGIFAINELPDLAGKIQVGLFNIMQEGDIQIKGYPLRLPLDVLIVFTANPEDYTARGKIITPLKDRIGAEIRTHYPSTVAEGMTVTNQEAWVGRVFSKRFGEVSFQPVIQWFELGGELKLPELASTAERYEQLSKIQGLMEHVGKLGVNDRKDAGSASAAAEMILEGLWAHRRIGRSEERGYFAEKPRQPEQRENPNRPRRQFN
jgi:MoxR-like ATPase